ncbi:MAG: ribonuclease G, partial [Lachnoanaerobaculum saburreum]
MSTAVKLSKLLITEYRGKLFAISYDRDRANEIEYIENNSLLGSIHIGRVKKISKNINAAFVEIEYNRERQIVYFDMEDFKYLIFADEKEHPVLHEGDDIVIRISKLPIKNKLAGATADISDVSGEVLDNIKARKNYIKSPCILYAGENDYIEIIKDRLKYAA